MAKQQNTTTTLLIVAIIAFGAGYFFGQQAIESEDYDDYDDDVMMEESQDAMDGDTMEKSDDTSMGKKDSMMDRENPRNFTLTGYILNEGGVHLEWVVPENRPTPERFMIVRGAEENPVHDGTNYWFRQLGESTETDWIDMPAGTYNFRICILKGETCEEYSNNLQLTTR